MDRPAPACLARPAAEVADCTKLSEAATKLLGQHNGADFLAALDGERLYADGIRFAAAALPKPHGLWWGCLCTWHAYRPTVPPKEHAALQAVVAWLQQPTDEHRRAAEKASTVAGIDNPGGGLALATFLSGGSMSLPNLPAVEPEPRVFARTLATAVLLASMVAEPARAPARQRQFIALVSDVATGRSRWNP